MRRVEVLTGEGNPVADAVRSIGVTEGDLLSLARLDISERLACRVLGQHRSTQRKAPKMADDKSALTAAIIDWARQVRARWLPPDHRPAAGGRLGLQP